MSLRNKLQKFAQLRSFPNVYENFNAGQPGLTGKDGQPVERKGRWATSHFGNQNPITLELACGKGEYAIGLAGMFPGRNLIGVDVKGARIWRGAKTALENNLPNACFLRTPIEQLPLFFEKNEVAEIWITFADPFLKKGKENCRLTAAPFLDRYKRVLQPGGLVHLKTDDPTLYGFTLETLTGQQDFALLCHDDDIYAKPLLMPELEIKTFYEKQHLAAGRTIKYVQFQLVGSGGT